MNLEQQQKIQEQQYEFPYHWFKSPNTFDGRLYFGYLNRCADLIDCENHESNILEVGCGDGRFLGLLQERGFKKLHGSDYSESGVGFARLFLPSVEFSVADATENLPYENGFFDVIFLIETLEHIQLEKVPRIFSEIARVLKPGGKMIITVPSTLVPQHPKHYQHFTVESLKKTVEPLFTVKELHGQDAANHICLEKAYKFLDNRWWQIKPLASWYNRKIWTKYFNVAKLAASRRFIVLAEKAQ